MERQRRAVTLALLLLVPTLMAGSIASTPDIQQQVEPAEWPDGGAAYDNMQQLANFGYRRIDTMANENGRDWIVTELEAMGYEVERQPFTSEECDNCENIVVTINGTLEKNWMVAGAHHDAICYSPA